MAFGQVSGPAASARQLRELLELLNEAGHSDFRDARGPMGFTQRQAGGRFTADEAAGFITQLEDAQAGGAQPPVPTPPVRVRDRPSTTAMRSRPAPIASLRAVPAESLAEELRRRGWMAIEPLDGLGPTPT